MWGSPSGLQPGFRPAWLAGWKSGCRLESLPHHRWRVFDITHPDVRRAVEAALAEDVGAGDITTDAAVPAALQAEAHFVAREPLTVAGVELLALLFNSPVFKVCSGSCLQTGQEIACVRGH